MKRLVPLIRSELRKLFSARSTYGYTGVGFGLVVLLSFYIQGIKASGPLVDASMLANISTNAVSLIAVFGALVAVLLVTHEYRYSTITYSLTSARSRLDFLLSKIIAISIYAIIVSLFVAVLAPLLTALGLYIHHAPLIHQHIKLIDLLWRIIFGGWAYAMYGLIIAFIVRAQVAAAVLLFIMPGPVEQLIGLLLKKNMAYLPFTALGSIFTENGSLSRRTAFLTVCIYIVGGWLVSWKLLKRRDAN